jgi:hypothetical protein
MGMRFVVGTVVATSFGSSRDQDHFAYSAAKMLGDKLTRKRMIIATRFIPLTTKLRRAGPFGENKQKG